MDILLQFLPLFLAGILGAFMSAYIAKEEMVPEFRPFFEVADKEKEAVELRSMIAKIRQAIDDIQLDLTNDTGMINPNQRENLKVVLDSSHAEIAQMTVRLEKIEAIIKKQQFNSRLSGFVAYILMGGILGGILSQFIDVEFISPDWPQYFEALAIGATWTSYLSLFGLKSGQKEAQAAVQQVQADTNSKLNELKNEVTRTFEMMPGMGPAGNMPANTRSLESSSTKQDAAAQNAKILLEKFNNIEKQINDNLEYANKRVRKY